MAEYKLSYTAAEIDEKLGSAVLCIPQTLTEAQKEQARTNIGAGVMPEFVDSIEECVDTAKQYVLPDGYIYAYKETEQVIKHTNHILSSIASDGSPYNGGVGYKTGYRLNSSGVEAALDAAAVSGFIPYNGEAVEFQTPSNGTLGGNEYLHYYDSNFNVIKQTADGTNVDGSYHQLAYWVSLYGASKVQQSDGTYRYYIPATSLSHANVKYIRVSANMSVFDASADTFDIALNESLDDTTITTTAWTKTSNKFGSDYGEEIADHEARIAALENNADIVVDTSSDIPDYVVSEAEATLAKAASHGILGRTIRFIAISDLHEDSEASYNAQISVSNKHAAQAIEYISNRIGLDFVACLGDVSSAGAFVVSYYFDVLRKDVEQINNWFSNGFRGIPNVRLVGNHDQFYVTDGTRLFNSGAYDLFGRFCTGKKDVPGGYGYFDLDSPKVRVIYLNTSDVPSATTAGTYLAMSDAQKNWVCETLINLNEKDDASEWGALLLSHAPLNFGALNITDNILLAYLNGGSYGNYVFTNHDAKIIGNVHGHVHCYSYGYLGDKIRRFTIPNACYVGNNHYGSREGYEQWVDTETYNKTANSGKDTAFSLVTIDLDSNTCYVDNYGAGIDRVFSTNYKPDADVVPQSISNITYSGSTTVGENIDASSFSYTVNYSDGTSSTKVGAISVSPTTIDAVGNNTVTISYTENDTTITGIVTVVGTAAPVVNLFDKNDADVVDTARFNSSKNAVAYAAGQLVTGYIAGEIGDTFTISSDKAQNTNGYTGTIMLYNASKTAIAPLVNAATASGGWTWSSDHLSGTITIPATYGNTSHAGTTWVRFCIAYTDIDSIVITKA